MNYLHQTKEHFARKTILTWIPLAAVIGIVCTVGMQKAEPKSTAALRSQRNDEEVFYLPTGRILYIVIDFDGIHFGSTVLPVDRAVRAIPIIVEQNDIRTISVLTTDNANYGDFVKIFAVSQKIAPKRSFIQTYDYHRPTDQPLFGTMRPVCCFSIDIENEIPESEDDGHSSFW